MILDFFTISANLKNISRQGWIDKLNHDNPESVADHTFSMAIIGMILADKQKLDVAKTLKMILIHDLAESVIGDLTPQQCSRSEKQRLEDNAMSKILATLPSDLQNNYSKIWQEYQSNITSESKLVHEIDRLEMALQATIYAKNGYSKQKISEFLKSASNEITGKELKEILRQILEQI